MATSDWLDEATWLLVQKAVPIACVDLIPMRRDALGETEVGLIRRSAPFPGGYAWCQMGGRVRRDELVRDAIGRHLGATLSGVDIELDSDPQPDYVMQWFPNPPKPEDVGGVRFGLDPRRHAIALSFVVALIGDEPKPVQGGEALDFAWVSRQKLVEISPELWPGTKQLLSILVDRAQAQGRFA